MVLNDSTSIKIPIKDKPHNQFPFPAIRSNLCTLTIFKLHQTLPEYPIYLKSFMGHLLREGNPLVVI